MIICSGLVSESMAQSAAAKSIPAMRQIAQFLQAVFADSRCGKSCQVVTLPIILDSYSYDIRSENLDENNASRMRYIRDYMSEISAKYFDSKKSYAENDTADIIFNIKKIESSRLHNIFLDCKSGVVVENGVIVGGEFNIYYLDDYSESEYAIHRDTIFIKCFEMASESFLDRQEGSLLPDGGPAGELVSKVYWRALDAARGHQADEDFDILERFYVEFDKGRQEFGDE